MHPVSRLRRMNPPAAWPPPPPATPARGRRPVSRSTGRPARFGPVARVVDDAKHGNRPGFRRIVTERIGDDIRQAADDLLVCVGDPSPALRRQFGKGNDRSLVRASRIGQPFDPAQAPAIGAGNRNGYPRRCADLSDHRACRGVVKAFIWATVRLDISSVLPGSPVSATNRRADWLGWP